MDFSWNQYRNCSNRGTYNVTASTSQRYVLLAVYAVNTGANITPTVSGTWGSVAFNSGTPTRFIGQFGSGARRTVFLFGFNDADIAGRGTNTLTVNFTGITTANFNQAYMSTFEGVNQTSPFVFASGATLERTQLLQYTAALLIP
ncbi:MAG: hypothetical protein IPQ16_00005 [Geobacteraceae bacterium]|nr:hypothetical protein [Geobacteraceae bacterium]